MKFLALKEALESVIRPTAKAENPSGPKDHPSQHQYPPREKHQTLVGGEVLFKPIDKTAALVVSKSPWWAKPPPETSRPVFTSSLKPAITNNKRKENNMSLSPKVHNITHPAQAQGTIDGKDKDDLVVQSELIAEFKKRAQTSIVQADMLVAKALDSRAALDVMSDNWKASWIEFTEQSDERLKELRMSRMAFETETKILMASLREVRQFFLDDRHKPEVERLREFVDLCERLQKLKQSGFLDTVVDTMIKLS